MRLHAVIMYYAVILHISILYNFILVKHDILNVDIIINVIYCYYYCYYFTPLHLSDRFSYFYLFDHRFFIPFLTCGHSVAANVC